MSPLLSCFDEAAAVVTNKHAMKQFPRRFRDPRRLIGEEFGYGRRAFSIMSLLPVYLQLEGVYVSNISTKKSL